MVCAYLHATKDGIVEEGRFRLTAMGLPFSLRSFMRSRRRFWTLSVKASVNSISFWIRGQLSGRFTLSCLVTEQLHRTITKIRDLVKSSEIEFHMHWITAHIGYAYNECDDALDKEDATLLMCRFFSSKIGSRGDFWSTTY